MVGLSREPAARVLDRYEPAYADEQLLDTLLSGGQRVRFLLVGREGSVRETPEPVWESRYRGPGTQSV